MECNPECTACDSTTCPDPHRICDICCNCKYSDTYEFNDKRSKFGTWYKNYLSVMHFNTRSLSKKNSELTYLLQCLDISLDIILISETKLNEGSDLSSIQLSGYQFFAKHSSLAWGGTGLYIANELDCLKRDDLDFQVDGCETTFIKLKTKT